MKKPYMMEVLTARDTNSEIVAVKGVNCYAQQIVAALNPVLGMDNALILAALKVVTASMASTMDETEKKLCDTLVEHIAVVTVHHPAGGTKSPGGQPNA